MTEREPLTETEAGVIAECCANYPNATPAKPEQLPTFAALTERGNLQRILEDGEVLFIPSKAFREAAALHAATVPDSATANPSLN